MRGNTISFQTSRYDLIAAAQGDRPADVVIQGGKIVNVYSGEILPGTVLIKGDRIAYVGSLEPVVDENTVVIDAEGQYVAPGFIETHAHPWVVYNPVSLAEKVLPLGTTAIAHDNLFFYMHLGAEGFRNMVKDLRDLPGLHFWLTRLVSQADYDGEREDFSQSAVQSLLELPEVIGTAEVTRWPVLYEGDPFVLDTISYAKDLGKISDGHTSGCSYDKLNSVVDAGISACHEAITVQEVLDRLRLGMWTTLRNSSLRPDLPEIVKAITEHHVNTSRMLMTTDGPHPSFVDQEGFVDGLLRVAVREGVNPVTAIQMVTVNAAAYLGLDEVLGGIAPGRRADIVLLPELETFTPSLVVSGGKVVARDGKLTAALPQMNWAAYPDKMPITLPDEQIQNEELYKYPVADSDGVAQVPIMKFKIAVITAKRSAELPVVDGFADITNHPGLVYATLIDRAGKWVSHALIDSFLGGAEGLASSYNTTTHILAMGRKPEAMAAAVRRVKRLGGGIVMVEDGEVVLEVPLPFTGMMTESPSFAAAVVYQEQLLKAVQDRGYPFHDILYSLLFLTCDFLPGLRLTPRGLIDVKTQEVLHPVTPLEHVSRTIT